VKTQQQCSCITALQACAYLAAASLCRQGSHWQLLLAAGEASPVVNRLSSLQDTNLCIHAATYDDTWQQLARNNMTALKACLSASCCICRLQTKVNLTGCASTEVQHTTCWSATTMLDHSKKTRMLVFDTWVLQGPVRCCCKKPSSTGSRYCPMVGLIEQALREAFVTQCSTPSS
jgi:hypothetical protein